MAFGDVVKSVTSFIGSTPAGPTLTGVAAGNSIVLLAGCRTFEGGIPSSVSDGINSGNYTNVAQNSTAIESQVAIFVFPNTAAGDIVVSEASSSIFVWMILEVEGLLNLPAGAANNGGSATTQSSFLTGASTIPAGSVSYGALYTSGNSVDSVAGPWSVVGGDNSFSAFRRADATEVSGSLSGTVATARAYGAAFASFTQVAAGPDYTQRKGSTFDATHTLGTITTATLNAVNVFDHVSSQAAGTVSFTGAVTDERTTSGVVDLVLGDGAATETYTVQVNVFGVVPSSNLAQKDGTALTSLTGVQVRITNGTTLNGEQRFYSATQTTDASGNFSTYDVSTSVAAAADPVLMHVLTAAGDSITSTETVVLI
jgi:hypothetical protein